MKRSEMKDIITISVIDLKYFWKGGSMPFFSKTKKMLRKGLEPSSQMAYAPQAYMYTNSITSASFTKGSIVIFSSIARLLFSFFKKLSTPLFSKKKHPFSLDFSLVFHITIERDFFGSFF